MINKTCGGPATVPLLRSSRDCFEVISRKVASERANCRFFDSEIMRNDSRLELIPAHDKRQCDTINGEISQLLKRIGNTLSAIDDAIAICAIDNGQMRTIFGDTNAFGHKRNQLQSGEVITAAIRDKR